MGAAVAAVDPEELVREALDDSGVRDFIGEAEVTVVAAGKAAEGMVGGLLTSVDMRIRRGVAVGPVAAGVIQVVHGRSSNSQSG